MRGLKTGLLFVFLFSTLSCKIIENTRIRSYYPLRHHTALSDESGDIITYVQWGEKLTYENERLTNGDKISIKVIRDIDGNVGYIPETKLLSNVLQLGVVLNPSILYDAPSVTFAEEKFQIFPPVLVYITETKDQEWMKVIPYIESDEEQSRIISLDGAFWIESEDVETNTIEVEMIIAIQQTIAKFRKELPTTLNELKESSKKYRSYIEEEVMGPYESYSFYFQAYRYANQALELFPYDQEGNPVPGAGKPKSSEELAGWIAEKLEAFDNFELLWDEILDSRYPERFNTQSITEENAHPQPRVTENEENQEADSDSEEGPELTPAPTIE